MVDNSSGTVRQKEVEIYRKNEVILTISIFRTGITKITSTIEKYKHPKPANLTNSEILTNV